MAEREARLSQFLASRIARALADVGDFGQVTLVVKHGRVAEIHRLATERIPEVA